MTANGNGTVQVLTKQLGAWLRQYREDHVLTQVQLGERLGVTGATISSIEHGHGAGAALTDSLHKVLGVVITDQPRDVSPAPATAVERAMDRAAESTPVVERRKSKRSEARDAYITELRNQRNQLDKLIMTIESL